MSQDIDDVLPNRLRYWLSLDLLDEDAATYSGPNHTVAVIDKAAWLAQGRPAEVILTVPRTGERFQ